MGGSDLLPEYEKPLSDRGTSLVTVGGGCGSANLLIRTSDSSFWNSSISSKYALALSFIKICRENTIFKKKKAKKKKNTSLRTLMIGLCVKMSMSCASK